MDDVDGMDEIVQEFLVESHENLDQLDRDLVQLEQEPDSRELLAGVFRTIHTIKGTSGFLAFGKLEAVTHVGENLLARLRDGRMVMTPGTTDVLLTMVDTVRALLARIEADGSEGDVDVAAVVAAITDVLEGRAPAVATPTSAPEAVDPDATIPELIDPELIDSELIDPEPVGPERVEPRLPDSEAVVEPVAAAPAAPPPPQPASPAPAADTSPEPSTEGPVRRTAAEASIRVDIDVLDDLMRLVGELVLTRNQIVRQTGGEEDVDRVRSSQRLNIIATELQESVMKTRMQPIDHLWSKLPRVVRDLGAQCGRQVRLVMVGKDVELDRTLLEAVKDPLTHLVRNAVDHGIETPQDRVAAGKPAEGVLTLRAYHEGGQVVVEVCDDGAGIDPERVAAKAVAVGLRTPDQLAVMSPTEVLQLIFAPGFSTKAAVSNVSGRGVGMDVVKTNIEAIGGAIELESSVGNGSVCRLRIPLTLAIVPALTVECAGDRYALPQVNLLELVALDTDAASHDIEEVGGAPVHRLRGQLLPLVHLADVLNVRADRTDGRVLIAVLQAEGKRFGLVIDRVLSTEEIVVKPLATVLRSLGIYSGATLLGDGAVALILDVQALARRAMSREGLERLQAEMPTTDTAQNPDRVLVTDVGDGRQVAIPLTAVTRLEHLPASVVEHVGSREVIQYRGEILPLLRLGRHLGAQHGTGEDHLTVVVYSRVGRSVAIVVERIVDIVDLVPTQVEHRGDLEGSGLLGAAVVRDRIIELLDVRAAVLAADPQFYDDERVPGDASFDDAITPTLEAVTR